MRDRRLIVTTAKIANSSWVTTVTFVRMSEPSNSSSHPVTAKNPRLSAHRNLNLHAVPKMIRLCCCELPIAGSRVFMQQLSKSQIDRLGDRLRKATINENDLRLLDNFR